MGLIGVVGEPVLYPWAVHLHPQVDLLRCAELGAECKGRRPQSAPAQAVIYGNDGNYRNEYPQAGLPACLLRFPVTVHELGRLRPWQGWEVGVGGCSLQTSWTAIVEGIGA